jgi:hypothetical protein
VTFLLLVSEGGGFLSRFAYREKRFDIFSQSPQAGGGIKPNHFFPNPFRLII